MNQKYDLRRKKAVKKAKIKFVIHCEGLNTEPLYLEALKRKYKNTLIEIQTFGGAGEPFTLSQKSLKARHKSRAQKDSFSEHDQYWVVFDRDEHLKFDEAIRYCAQHKLSVAKSNPCFELWLILHLQDYDKACTRHEVQKYLSKLNLSYDPKGSKTLDFNTLIAAMEEAEERASKQLERRSIELAPFGSPSTTFGHLTKAIRVAASV